MKEGNESITQVAGTETSTIEVTKLAEQKITERLHDKEDKRQGKQDDIFWIKRSWKPGNKTVSC